MDLQLRGGKHASNRELARSWGWNSGESVRRFINTYAPECVVIRVPQSIEEKALAEAHVSRAKSERVELAWRSSECWDSYCRTRERWLRLSGDLQPGEPFRRPALSTSLRKYIAAAIETHDAAWMEEGQRAEWKEGSWARASGMGIFMDPWQNGSDPKNDRRNGGKAWCLEPERAWKPKDGVDPVTKFAELFFASRVEKRRAANGVPTGR